MCEEQRVRSMSKYGEFEVVRAEMLKCKRANDPNADANGMREYSYLKCPHCNTGAIEIATTNLFRQKFSAIKDHIVICPSYTGERPTKRGKTATTTTSEVNSTALVVAPIKTNELAELEAKVAVLTQKMADSEKEKEEMKRRDVEKDRRLENLESKTCLYDSVLEAVMPSLALPLTAPVENAKITLREAAIKDIAPRSLALSEQVDVVSREMHTAMIEHKDAMIATEKAHKEEFNDLYKKQLEDKNSELQKAISEKEAAEKKTKELQQATDESAKTAASASSRADRLQKERDAFKAKFDASIKGHEQSVRNHGKHGQSMLAKLLYTEKRGKTGVTDQEADEARAIERAYAKVERERETLKRARNA